MKICFFAQDFKIEPGASRSMLALIEMLKHDGHEVIVILITKGTIEASLKKLNVKYYYCRTSALTTDVDTPSQKNFEFYEKKYGSLLNIWKLSRILKNENIDLIHINKAVGIFGAVLAKQLNVPFIWHFREFLKDDYGRKFIDEAYVYKLMKKADKRIAISEAVRDYWTNELDTDFDLIYNGINSDTITYSKEKKFQNGTIRILIVGTIVEGKRQLDAIKAVNLLKNQYNIEVTIVGDVLSESYYDELVGYIKEHDLSGIIRIIDYTDNLDKLRRNYDIGMLCSEKEAFGRVTVETMLSGMLFIGTKSGGTKELVKDNVTGLLYQPGDIDELASKIEYAINHTETMKNIIQNAYDYAKDTFSMKKTYQKIVDIYNEIIFQKNSL